MEHSHVDEEEGEKKTMSYKVYCKNNSDPITASGVTANVPALMRMKASCFERNPNMEVF